MIIEVYFFLVLIEIIETVQMRGHNISFLFKIDKNCPQLSPNTPVF